MHYFNNYTNEHVLYFLYIYIYIFTGQTQMPVYPQQPQMQYAYNGPAQPQYGAPMPPQPPQTVQPPQYGGPPECFAKPPPYYVPLIDINWTSLFVIPLTKGQRTGLGSMYQSVWYISRYKKRVFRLDYTDKLDTNNLLQRGFLGLCHG